MKFRAAQMHRIPIEGSIDLHAFQPRDIKNVVEDYIDAAFRRKVRLIHCRLKGVQAASCSKRWNAMLA